MLGEEQGEDDAKEPRDAGARDEAEPFLVLVVLLNAANQPNRLDDVGQDKAGANQRDRSE